MAEQKIFAGPRIRRIRLAKGLTQSSMAAGLGISPSYLNLIERNQRPLTVQLLLKLAAVYQVEPRELQGETKSSTALLKAVFADPLLAGELPGEQEVIDLVEAAPNAAAAMLKLHRAYREQAGRLSALGGMLGIEGEAPILSSARLPADEVREALEHRPNHFAAIEAGTEALSELLAPGDDLWAALKGWLKRERGVSVKVLPVATMPNWRRRYDRHSQRLFLSERLSPADRLREVAAEVCLLGIAPAISAEIEALKLTSDEARRLARLELARYAAHALMMPHTAFRDAARRVRYDIDVLCSRFGVSFEQAANRLTSLRAGGSSVPFFSLEVDHAGNRLRRSGANGFPHARFGGACPKLPLHAAFAQPGHILVEAVAMPDGAAFLCVARTVDGPRGAFNERPRRTALMLGCDIGFGEEVVYSAAVAAGQSQEGGRSAAVPIGPACRLCERVGCLSRAEPPVTRPLGLDDMAAGLSTFDFQ